MKKFNDQIKRNYFLIDICGTYVNDNTTFGLIKKHYAKTTIRGIFVRMFLYKYSPLKILVFFLEKISGNEILKRILIYSIRGVEVSSLEKTANKYAKELISKKYHFDDRVRKYIEKYKKISFPIFASASIEPIVRAIAFQERIPYVSTQLEIVNNKYTGKISNDIKGLKAYEIYKKFNIDINKNDYFLITDNKSDLNLVRDSLLTIFILRKKITFNISFLDRKRIQFLYLNH